jgi:hypothetical protein
MHDTLTLFFVVRINSYIATTTTTDSPLTNYSNLCPVLQCTGTVTPVDIPLAAFKKRKRHQPKIATSICKTCNTNFCHNDVLNERCASHSGNTCAADNYRCIPPSIPLSPDGISLEKAYLSCQVHSHTGTKTSTLYF